MRVKALRGVCVGPEDNMKEGDERDLDPVTADHLKNIGAVVEVPAAAEVPHPPPPPGPTAEQEAAVAAAAASGTQTAPA